MADAIRQLTVRKVLIPESLFWLLLAAGPMHACSTAEERRITRVLIPEILELSAWGCCNLISAKIFHVHTSLI